MFQYVPFMRRVAEMSFSIWTQLPVQKSNCKRNTHKRVPLAVIEFESCQASQRYANIKEDVAVFFDMVITRGNSGDHSLSSILPSSGVVNCRVHFERKRDQKPTQASKFQISNFKIPSKMWPN